MADEAAREEGPPAEPGERNEVRVVANGPYVVSGDVRVHGEDGELLLQDSRVALCRCGRSSSKPLCDGSHAACGFADPGHVAAPPTPPPPAEEPMGPLEVKAAPGGPLLLAGTFDVCGVSGRLGFRDGRGALCRCGASGNMPLCDGSHRHARPPEAT